MLIYLGFFAVLLITSEVRNISEILRIDQNFIHKDNDNNIIDIVSYCESKTCVLKCCPNGKEILNKEGICHDEDFVDKIGHMTDYFISVKSDRWSYTTGHLDVSHRKLYENFGLILNSTLSNADTYYKTNFYILKNGFLQMKINNKTEQWLGAPPLGYCVDTRLSVSMNQNKQINIVYRVPRKVKNNADTEIFKYVAGGMLVSLLVLGLVVYRKSSKLIKMLGLILMAFIFSLAAAYILTAVQLLALRAGNINSTECRIMSPFLYFFLLSSFFWVNVMSFDTWWIIRNFRKYSTKIYKEVDTAKFFRLSMYGWIIPFFITIVGVVVDILKLDLILPVAKPPFDSCLANDNQMKVYTYIPISILTATNCMFFLLNIYNIWMLQRAYYNIIDITSIIVTKRKFIALKFFAIIGVSAALELVPDVPTVIYYAIHVNNILVGSTLFLLFMYEKCTYNVTLKRSNINQKYNNIYRKLFGTVSRRATVSTIFMGENNTEDLQKIAAIASANAALVQERNRY